MSVNTQETPQIEQSQSLCGAQVAEPTPFRYDARSCTLNVLAMCIVSVGREVSHEEKEEKESEKTHYGLSIS